ncbi:hypothetical protein Dsin_023454 [Dipteronia sinensis]|uniref:Uncharacterized protein n=1 Tax=Dipteronia sinensis TaxID=43782 RepID=A0AAE0A4H0_9ROSI|nr:hypothetical protein Dsin_023454 [Dipteronia sinensis]
MQSLRWQRKTLPWWRRSLRLSSEERVVFMKLTSSKDMQFQQWSTLTAMFSFYGYGQVPAKGFVLGSAGFCGLACVGFWAQRFVFLL